MTLQQLVYFQSVASSGSFTKAARKHFVSQTAISRQIQQLEQELKVSLLERNTAHVRLTAAGRFFYEKTSALCAELQQTVEQTRALDYETRTHLTLGIPSIVESHAVSLHLRAFHNACPQVAVRFSAGSRQGLVTALVQGKIDLLIAQDFDLPELKGLAYTLFGEDEFAWVLPSNHPLAGCKQISPAALAGETLLIPGDLSSSTGEFFARYFRQLGLEQNPRIHTKDLTDAFMLLGAGYGIGLVPFREEPWMKPDMCCARIDGPRCTIRMLAVFRPESANPNVQAFLQAL